MPTIMTPEGVTFNDDTSLTSANIGSSQIIAGAVGSTQIAAGAVIDAKIINGSVIESKLGSELNGTLAKAWVNFNGTGAVGAAQTIRSHYNVSSVTRTDTGIYRINFINNMVDANYVVVGTSNDSHSPTANGPSQFGVASTNVGNCVIFTSQGNTTTTTIAASIICCCVFGN